MPEVVSKIMEWRSKRAAAFAKAQDVHERATQEKRQLKPEEKREFDQWIGKGQELTQTIEREEQLRDLERLSLHQNSEGRTSEAPKPGDPQTFTPTTEPRDNQLADLENRQLAAYRGFCALGENGLNADERRDLGTARTQADAQAAGGALVVSQSIRMGGYQTVLFFGSITTANPANIATIRQSSDNGITFRDLAGASLAVSADGNVWAIEIYQPSAPELRVEIARGVATATSDFWCLRMTGRRQPARQLPNVETLLLQSPQEVNP